MLGFPLGLIDQLDYSKKKKIWYEENIQWIKSIAVPFYKHKEDIQNVTNYRAVKLISHTLKL